MGFLAASEVDQRAGSYAIGGELVVLKKSAGGHDPLFSPVEARRLGGAAENVFLGLCDGAARFVSQDDDQRNVQMLDVIQLARSTINRWHNDKFFVIFQRGVDCFDITRITKFFLEIGFRLGTIMFVGWCLHRNDVVCPP